MLVLPCLASLDLDIIEHKMITDLLSEIKMCEKRLPCPKRLKVCLSLTRCTCCVHGYYSCDVKAVGPRGEALMGGV